MKERKRKQASRRTLPIRRLTSLPIMKRFVDGPNCAKDGRPRLFSKIDTAAATMRDLGLTQVVIDLAGHTEDQRPSRRPDRSEALKRAHAAAAHDAWFRQQVQGTLDRISSGETRFRDHDEVFDALEASAGTALVTAK